MNCKVQEGKFSDWASKHMRLEGTQKKFKLDTVNFSKEGEEEAKLAVNQHITVVGKWCG